MKHTPVLFCLYALCFVEIVKAVELTFELADNAKQCFYEDIEKGIESTIDYQVVDGGNYDVDVILESPSGGVLMRSTKSQSDSYTFTTDQKGVYSLCFSNEFSTFTHKLVYVDFSVGKEKPLPGLEDHPTLTKVEASSVNIHEHLNAIIDYQTHHRLMEAKGQRRAEDLNTRVMHWSIGESLVIVFVCICQIMILKSFFSDRK